MKTCSTLAMLFVLIAQPYSQTATLTVINGYGSGTYAAGDTVDVWSTAYYGKDYFDRWAGDTAILNDVLDWHTRLVMPDHDVTIEAVIGTLPDGATFFTTAIPGVDTIKPVWIGFPGTLTIRGLVWLFHGTNGSGENFFLNNDMVGCVKKMMSEGYAVIGLDCEEKTYDMDFNGDDVYRWDYTFDSLVNIDLRNVKAIRDTLIRRGWIDSNTKHLGFGYSAGGAFATHAGTQLRWFAGVSHNSAGIMWVPTAGLTPMLYSMTQFDDHPEVGPEAAVQAETNAALFNSRGICSQYRYAYRQPLYPERFNRDSTISLALSIALFDELKSNGMLNDEHYLLVKSNELAVIIDNNPMDWPVALGLTNAQRISVADEIDETYATHRFNSDLFGSDMRFMNSLCSLSTDVEEVESSSMRVYPNPVNDVLYVESEGKQYAIYNTAGKIVLNANQPSLDTRSWAPGMYVVKMKELVVRVVKQ